MVSWFEEGEVRERPGNRGVTVQPFDAFSPVMSDKDMGEDPHHQARNVHIEWEDERLGK